MTDDDRKKLRERAEAAPSACALDCGYCEPCEDARSRRHDFSPTTVIALLDDNDWLRDEKWKYGGEAAQLREQLAAMTAARHEACDIAERVIADGWPTPNTDSMRIAELRRVGGDK